MTPAHLDDAERRRRMAVRHRIAPQTRAVEPMQAVRDVVALHSTEPPTVHLSLHARTGELAVADVEALLYTERSLVKQLAMRRTLWAGPRDLLPALLGSSSARVAATERAKVVKDVVAHGLAEDGDAWIETAFAAVRGRLADGEHLSAVELRKQVPELHGSITVDTDKKYGGTFNVSPRVLTAMGATGEITRGRNGGHWRTSRPQWAETASWLGERAEPLEAAAGWAELIRRYLDRFGPATEEDVVWWLGATKGIVRTALTTLAAEAVSLDSGATGWVLPGDTDLTEDPGEWAALLPVLDPTLMGWKERAWYLDPAHVPYLFDTNGNGGTTAWWNGRVVGAWVQDDDATVRTLLRDDVPAHARHALEAEAERVTAFLDGTVISSVYKSALMKGEVLP